MKVTDYERIATVVVVDDKFACPKCGGQCKLRNFQYDCNKCGRGWDKIDDNVQTLNELFK